MKKPDFTGTKKNDFSKIAKKTISKLKSIDFSKIKNFRLRKKDVIKFIKGSNRKLVLEVGSYNIKMIEIEKDETLEISKGFITATPGNSIDEERITNVEAVAESIKEKMKEERFSSQDVVVSLTSKDIITRELTLPKMKKEDMDRVIAVNASDVLPVKIENYALGYSIIEEVTEKEGVSCKILITAIPRDIIIPYILLAENLKLSLKAFNFSGFALYNFIDFEFEDREDNFVVVDMGAKNTDLIIVSNGLLKFNRVINIGSNKITEIIAEKLNCPITKAEKLKRQYNSVIVLGNLEGDSEVYTVAKIMQEVIEQIMKEILTIIEFYNSNHSRSKVTKIYMTGLASRVSGLEEYVEGISGMQVVRIREFSKVTFGQHAKRLRGRQLALVNCLGTEELNGRSFNFLKGDLKLSNFLMILSPNFYKVLICGVLLILLLASAINFNVFLVKKESEGYESYLSSKSGISLLQNEIKNKEQMLNSKNAVIDSIAGGAESMDAEFKNIESAVEALSNRAIIKVSKYKIAEGGKIDITCSATAVNNPPSDFLFENSSYDFSTELQKYFEVKESSMSNMDAFSFALLSTEKK